MELKLFGRIGELAHLFFQSLLVGNIFRWGSVIIFGKSCISFFSRLASNLIIGQETAYCESLFGTNTLHQTAVSQHNHTWMAE